MMDDNTISQFGRRVRLGMVGGGQGSIIGETHMLALRADGICDLVAGALSSRPDVARASAARQMISSDRTYTDFREMAEREADRSDGIDAVIIATPPHNHLEIAKLFLERGIDVICEKPMTRTVEEAQELVDLVDRTGRLFCLTHCYTGYPMARDARAQIDAGLIGDVRMIEMEFCPGEPGTALESADPADRHWRFKSDIMGKAAILGEVGSHAYNMATFITGQSAERVSAQLDTFAPNREVYDNAYLNVDYGGGIKGRIWSSYVAAGNNMGFKFRVFGSTGSLAWDQESPEKLVHKTIGGPAIILERGYEQSSPDALRSNRFRPGFPEGYGLAFANLYLEFAKAIIARELGQDPKEYMRLLPSVSDGLAGMCMIAAAEKSHENDGVWIPLTRR